jgi:hypothetical protein
VSQLDELCRELQRLRAERRKIIEARRRRGVVIGREFEKWRAAQRAAGRRPQSIGELSLSLGLYRTQLTDFARRFGHLSHHAAAVSEITGIRLELLAQPPGKAASRILNAKAMTAVRMAKKLLPVVAGNKVPRIYQQNGIGAALRITRPLGAHSPRPKAHSRAGSKPLPASRP